MRVSARWGGWGARTAPRAALDGQRRRTLDSATWSRTSRDGLADLGRPAQAGFPSARRPSVDTVADFESLRRALFSITKLSKMSELGQLRVKNSPAI